MKIGIVIMGVLWIYCIVETYMSPVQKDDL